MEKIRPGKRHRSFEKNVVAIGLAAVFLEPLESTSIHLIQTGLLRLLALLPGAGFHPADVAEYNRQTDEEYREVRDFIIAHYKVTNREDTPFWAYVKDMHVPDSLRQRLELFASSARFFKDRERELFREESWVQVLLGQGFQAAYDPSVDLVPEAQIMGYLKDIVDVIAATADSMPSHSDYIARTCAAPVM